MRVPPLSRPEHTGENRCWPCTVLNVLLVGVVALVVGRRRRGMAVLVAAVGAAAVYARGYVVPYTPAFAPRLTAALGLDPTGHEPGAGGVRDPDSRPSERGGDASLAAAGGSATGETAPAGEALFGTLLEAGVLAAADEEVALAPGVEDRWEAEMADLRALDDESLAAAVRDASAASEARSVTDDSWATPERRYVVLSTDSDAPLDETWLSRPVAIAETAAVRALAGVVEDPGTRRAAASAMRVFLESCPDCSAPVRETTTAACCGATAGTHGEPSEVLACPDCDVRLHTFE
jgi:hypothetical protein